MVSNESEVAEARGGWFCRVSEARWTSRFVYLESTAAPIDCRVDRPARLWEFPTVHTLVVDSKKRVRLPDAKPNQVFAYEQQGEGQFLLTRLIKEEPAESFPRGSLKKYLTRAKAKEELALLKGCSLEVPE